MWENERFSCCFSGHRDLPGEEVAALFAELLEKIRFLYARGFRRFLSGGALGFDLLAARAVLDEKREHPDIRLHFALPCPDQAKHWNPADRALYERMVGLADEVTVVSPGYTLGCMQRRNRFLVDESDACIAYLTKLTGGTAYTVAYANKKNIPVYLLRGKSET